MRLWSMAASDVTGVSIIIVSYNTMHLLRDCLNSIAQSEACACERIVVDNGSNDGSADMVEREFPGVLIIRNAQNVGFAKANNQGISAANGKYFLLLNSDTIVRSGAIAAMSKFLDREAAAGGVACRLLNGDGTIQPSISNRPGPVFLLFRQLGLARLVTSDRSRRWLASSLGLLLGRTVRTYLTPYVADRAPVEVECISAACLMLRKAAVDQVGALDEQFFMYLEDMDYCLRLKQAGWKLYYIPGGDVVHFAGQSSGGRMRNYSPQSYHALFQFYRKHYSMAAAVEARAMVVTVSAVLWAWNWFAGRFSHRAIYQQNEKDLKQIIRVCLGRTPLGGAKTHLTRRRVG
jgi:GT2 family glycosyltransferase